jgi:hypothetical protein
VCVDMLAHLTDMAQGLSPAKQISKQGDNMALAGGLSRRSACAGIAAGLGLALD